MCNRAKELAEFDYDASIQEASDRLRFQQEIGSSACKSVLLVNGDAIIGGNSQSLRFG
jgi:hypothetical protein